MAWGQCPISLKVDTNTLSENSGLNKTFPVSLMKHKLAGQISGVCMLSCFSHVQLFGTLWTVAYQAPPSMRFFRQEYWSGLPFPPPGDLPDPRIEPASPVYPALLADSLLSDSLGKPLTMANWTGYYGGSQKTAIHGLDMFLSIEVAFSIDWHQTNSNGPQLVCTAPLFREDQGRAKKKKKEAILYLS